MAEKQAWEILWEKERELLVLMDEIRLQTTISEGSRKTIHLNEDERQITPVVNPAPIQSGQAQRGLVLPGGFTPTPAQEQPSRIRQNQFMGGSIQSRLDALTIKSNQDDSTRSTIWLPEADVASDVKGNNGENNFENLLSDILTSDDKKDIIGASSRMHFTPSQIRNIGPSESQHESQKTTSLKEKAHTLSKSILELRSQLGVQMWMCDQVSARQVAEKLGQPITFAQDGLDVLLPDTPLAKTCLGRRGYIGRGTWICECVLCPVNYLDSTGHFDAWQNFIEERRADMKQPDNPNSDKN